MIWLRSAAFAAFQVVTVSIWGIVCLLCAPLPLSWRYRVTIQWPRMVIWAAKAICGIRWEVRGLHNLPQGPAVLLSKHQSTWETLFYVGWMPRELCFVFKRELLLLPFFGWGIGLLRMIHIDRKRGADAIEQVIRQGREKLDQGRWVIMFPEGTRIPVGQKGRYKLGGARLAVATSTPVVPLAVNSGECWPKKSFLKKPGLITVSIGPIIETGAKRPEEVGAEVEHWIESEMRAISPHRYEEKQPQTITQD